MQMLMSVRLTLITVTHMPPVSTHQDITTAPAGMDGLEMESNVLVGVIHDVQCYITGLRWCVFCNAGGKLLCNYLYVVVPN